MNCNRNNYDILKSMNAEKKQFYYYLLVRFHIVKAPTTLLRCWLRLETNTTFVLRTLMVRNLSH